MFIMKYCSHLIHFFKPIGCAQKGNGPPKEVGSETGQSAEGVSSEAQQRAKEVSSEVEQAANEIGSKTKEAAKEINFKM